MIYYQAVAVGFANYLQIFASNFFRSYHFVRYIPIVGWSPHSFHFHLEPLSKCFGVWYDTVLFPGDSSSLRISALRLELTNSNVRLAFRFCNHLLLTRSPILVSFPFSPLLTHKPWTIIPSSVKECKYLTTRHTYFQPRSNGGLWFPRVSHLISSVSSLSPLGLSDPPTNTRWAAQAILATVPPLFALGSVPVSGSRD